jgi:hypothetical protein
LAFDAGAGMHMALLGRHRDLQCAAFATGATRMAGWRAPQLGHGIAVAFVYDGANVAKQALADNAS